MSNQAVVITGASKGIGHATALHLDKLGYQVFAGVRKEEDGAVLKAESGDRLIPVIIDVTKQDTIETAAKQVSEAVGDAGVYGLVNNAGISVIAPMEFIPLDELRWQLEVNVIGQLAVTQAFLPMIRQATGRVINMSSIGGLIVVPISTAYNISKFALEAMTDGLRMELSEWGIEVVAIEPGAIATPIWKTSYETAQRILKLMPDKVQELYGKQIDKLIASAEVTEKRGIPPQEVAKVVEKALTAKRPKPRYPVGNDASFVTRFLVLLPARIQDRLIMSQ